jgi:hypothetical protein
VCRKGDRKKRTRLLVDSEDYSFHNNDNFVIRCRQRGQRRAWVRLGFSQQRQFKSQSNMKVSLLLATVLLGGCLIAQADVGDGKQAPPPSSPPPSYSYPQPQQPPQAYYYPPPPSAYYYGVPVFIGGFYRLSLVLTSGDRATSRATGAFITGAIFAVSDAAVTIDIRASFLPARTSLQRCSTDRQIPLWR